MVRTWKRKGGGVQKGRAVNEIEYAGISFDERGR